MREGPVRTCAVCRVKRPQVELHRFVRGRGGEVVADPQGRAPGRGAYLCKTGDCSERAAKEGSLERALRPKEAIVSTIGQNKEAIVSTIGQNKKGTSGKT